MYRYFLTTIFTRGFFPPKKKSTTITQLWSVEPAGWLEGGARRHAGVKGGDFFSSYMCFGSYLLFLRLVGSGNGASGILFFFFSDAGVRHTQRQPTPSLQLRPRLSQRRRNKGDCELLHTLHHTYAILHWEVNIYLLLSNVLFGFFSALPFQLGLVGCKFGITRSFE